MEPKQPPTRPKAVRPRQFTLRAILLVATVVPPLIGGFWGAFGPTVQSGLWMAIGIPGLALALMGLTLVVCYVVFVMPLIPLAKQHDLLAKRLDGSSRAAGQAGRPMLPKKTQAPRRRNRKKR